MPIRTVDHMVCRSHAFMLILFRKNEISSVVSYGYPFVSKFNDCPICIQRLFYLYSTGFPFTFNGVSFIFNDSPVYIQRPTFCLTFIQRLFNFYSTSYSFSFNEFYRTQGEVCKFVKILRVWMTTMIVTVNQLI